MAPFQRAVIREQLHDRKQLAIKYRAILAFGLAREGFADWESG
jgi:hypothetical protein